MHVGPAGFMRMPSADLCQTIQSMLLGRIKDDTDHNASPVGVDKRVDDWPIRQGEGRQVDFRARGLQKRHVHALKVLDRRIIGSRPDRRLLAQ